MRYLALGDSTATGIGAARGGYPPRLLRRLRELEPRAELVNLAVSGATSEAVLSRQVARLEGSARVATLCVGANDATRLVAPELYARNVRAIVARLLDTTSATVVVTNVPDLSHAPVIPPLLRPLAREVIRAYNGALGELAHERVVVVDAFGLTGDAVANARGFFSSDGFHPSDEGYELWANALWPHVERAWRAPQRSRT
jgi:acyl-CoA thioesterase-1